MSRFQRQLLPNATVFFEREVGPLSRPSRSGWRACRCPFHQSKSGRSFAVHTDGAFVCRGCGVKGGDLIAFLRLRYGLNFKEACRQLGCWDEDAKLTKVRPGPLVRYLVMDFTIDGVEYRAEGPDEPKTELQRLRRSYAEAKDRLSEIREGDAEVFEGEEETQWGILASSSQLIHMEVSDGN